MMMVVVMSPSGRPSAIPATPAEVPTGTVPTVPAEAIGIAAPTPSIGVIAPIPPQAVGEGGESIGVKPVGIYVPVPGIQPVDYIPVERAADADGIAGITETDDARGVFIIVFRTFKAVHPLPFEVGPGFFFYVEGIVLKREVIIPRVVAAVVFVYVAGVAFAVFHYNCRVARRGINRGRGVRLYYYGITGGGFLLLHLLFLFLGRDVVKVVIYTLCRQRPREAQGCKR